jgi:hypothetical protein
VAVAGGHPATAGVPRLVGFKPGLRGIDPVLSTVTVSLGDPEAARRADREAHRALVAAGRSALGRKLETTFSDYFSTVLPLGASSHRCELALGGLAAIRHIPALCFAAVDLSGTSPVVVFTEMWDGRDFRAGGAPARPDLTHTWALRVSPDGRVLATSGAGFFPLQDAR